MDKLSVARKALEKCRAQFDFYVSSHMAKQPPDMDKAATNQEFVEMINEALAALAQPAPDDAIERITRLLTERRLYRVSYAPDEDGRLRTVTEPASDADAKAILAALTPAPQPAVSMDGNAAIMDAVAAERERCLQIVDDRMPRNDPSDWTEWAKIRAEVLTDIAAAIRGGAE